MEELLDVEKERILSLVMRSISSERKAYCYALRVVLVMPTRSMRELQT